MTRYLAPFVALLLFGCSTAQIDSARAIADPITVALVSGYASTYGIPPSLSAPLITTLQNEGWSMASQLWKGNPVASGASTPTVGAAVAVANPTPDQLVTAINTLTTAKSNPSLAASILSAASKKVASTSP